MPSSSEIHLFTPKRTRQELQHYRGQADVSAQLIDGVGDVTELAFGRMLRARATAAQAAALDPGAAQVYEMFTVTAAMAMNSVIADAAKRSRY